MSTEALLDRAVFPEAVPAAPYHFDEGPRKLRMKLRMNPSRPTVHVVDDATGAPAIYVVVNDRRSSGTKHEAFGDFRLMTLMDYGFFTRDPANPDRVVRAALTLFRQSSADVLEMVSASPAVNAAARGRGLLRVGKGMSFVFAVPPSWKLGEGAAELTSWHLTHFAGDAFSFS